MDAARPSENARSGATRAVRDEPYATHDHQTTDRRPSPCEEGSSCSAEATDVPRRRGENDSIGAYPRPAGAPVEKPNRRCGAHPLTYAHGPPDVSGPRGVLMLACRSLELVRVRGLEPAFEGLEQRFIDDERARRGCRVPRSEARP